MDDERLSISPFKAKEIELNSGQGIHASEIALKTGQKFSLLGDAEISAKTFEYSVKAKKKEPRTDRQIYNEMSQCEDEMHKYRDAEEKSR